MDGFDLKHILKYSNILENVPAVKCKFFSLFSGNISKEKFHLILTLIISHSIS